MSRTRRRRIPGRSTDVTGHDAQSFSGEEEKMTDRRSAVIAGVGETQFSRNSERSGPELMSEAIELALADAGLEHRDVTGLSIGTMSIIEDSPYLAEQLG